MFEFEFEFMRLFGCAKSMSEAAINFRKLWCAFKIIRKIGYLMIFSKGRSLRLSTWARWKLIESV